MRAKTSGLTQFGLCNQRLAGGVVVALSCPSESPSAPGPWRTARWPRSGPPGTVCEDQRKTSAKSTCRLRDAGAWNKSWRCSWTARITDRSDWPPTPHLSQNASTCPSSAWGDLTGLELVWPNSCLGLEFLWVAGGWSFRGASELQPGARRAPRHHPRSSA